jgi:hypothetical protein
LDRFVVLLVPFTFWFLLIKSGISLRFIRQDLQDFSGFIPVILKNLAILSNKSAFTFVVRKVSGGTVLLQNLSTLTVIQAQPS